MNKNRFTQAEEYQGYVLTASPVKMHNGRWAVSVRISLEINGLISEKKYFADDRIWYILEEEAGKEALNLGRNLINRMGSRVV